MSLIRNFHEFHMPFSVMMAFSLQICAKASQPLLPQQTMNHNKLQFQVVIPTHYLHFIAYIVLEIWSVPHLPIHAHESVINENLTLVKLYILQVYSPKLQIIIVFILYQHRTIVFRSQGR